MRVIRRADERALLAGLPVRRLWGIGPVAEEKLHRLGIETIGQLAALTEAEVANILGRQSGPRCTGWPAASTTARWPNAPKPSRSAPSPPSRPT
ncbi:IMS HHH motif family protein [Mycobacterium xenopi 4042]|uniref:IMS HHH motif family protein n=1 Tax=Mycobacterium xenopi 4042 TaxID=1299334 RepID=X7YNT9_MYCXE|nr:IMS HHH motif family protein [Mycobacterium xenopi 4042]